MKHAIAFLFVLGTLSACSDAGTEGPSATLDSPTPTSSISISEDLPPGDPETVLNALVNGSADLKELVAARESWKEADTAVRSYLGDADPAMEPALREVAAVVMLEDRLLKGESTPEKRDAIVFYRDILVDAGSLQTELLRSSQAALRDE